jgi:putative SOS response-associated peptidase YedK
MCNLYNVKANPDAIQRWAKSDYEKDLNWSEKIAVRKFGPGIFVNEEGQRELILMRFSLIPVGAKSANQYKPPYNNARVESLDKWPWKMSINRRCILPLTSFQEPCYWGPPAGHQVEFYSPDEPILGVAGLYHQFESGDDSLTTMTFIMRPACEYIMEHGHQRQPFLLNPEGFDDWFAQDKLSSAQTRQMLAKWAFEPELDYHDLGEMKSGWKNRQEEALGKREAETDNIEKYGPFGCDMSK